MLAERYRTDSYHRALFYTLGLSKDTRAHIQELFDFSDGGIKPEGWTASWQTGGSLRICRLAFNLWNGWSPIGEGRYSMKYEGNPRDSLFSLVRDTLLPASEIWYTEISRLVAGKGRRMKKQQQTRTAVYCRLSRDDEQSSDSMSIENQRILLRRYAKEHGFEVVEVYMDDSWSGTNFDRSDFQRMKTGY